MAGRECYHCKQWVEEGEAHNCWTTTEEALTRDLPLDLREAWERVRETAADFGEQRIYASLNSIMFSRQACYCFVRPKTKFLELCVFLGRSVTAPQLRRSAPASKTKIAHLFHIKHRDEVEPPITDWMREAYEQSDALSARAKAMGRSASAPAASKVASPTVVKAKTRTTAKASSRAKSGARATATAAGGRTKATASVKRKSGRKAAAKVAARAVRKKAGRRR